MFKNAVALLTRKPDEQWLSFLSKFTNYDIYIIIDDNVENYDKIYGKDYPDIYFIQIGKDDCLFNGFIDSSTATNLPRIVAWDKALYFFSNHCKKYNNVWFFEEDVFLYSENVLLELDAEFPEEDLLSKNHNIKQEDEVLDWHWKHVYGRIELPWACSLVSVCRLSTLLLKKIGEYAKQHSRLFFIEAMFNTIAEHNHMRIGGRVPGGNGKLEKFKFIDHMGDSEKLINNDNKHYLFHPIKDISKHQKIRDMFIDDEKPTRVTDWTDAISVNNDLFCNPDKIQEIFSEEDDDTKVPNQGQSTDINFQINSVFNYHDNFITNMGSTIKFN